MVSNGSRSVVYLNQVAKYLNYSYLTFHSDQGEIVKFLERLHVFHPKRVLVYLPMNPLKWEKCMDAHTKITAAGYRVVAKTIFEDYGGGNKNTSIPYTKEQQSFIDRANKNLVKPGKRTAIQGKLPLPVKLKGNVDLSLDSRMIQIFEKGKPDRLTTSQNLVITNQNNYSGYFCYGGLEEICITATGQVFSTVCMQDGQLANIYETPNFRLPKEPMVCKRSNCWCESDLLLTKVYSTPTPRIIPIYPSFSSNEEDDE
jgi:hypothetical protein